MPVLDLPGWTPAVTDVALRLISRTKGSNGVLQTDDAGNPLFNELTKPTGVVVQAIIEQAVRLLRPRLGEVPDRLADSAQALATLRAAMMVEQSWFTEQIDTGLSPYKDLQGEYMSALKDWDAVESGDIPGQWGVSSMPIGTLYPRYTTGTP